MSRTQSSINLPRPNLCLAASPPARVAPQPSRCCGLASQKPLPLPLTEAGSIAWAPLMATRGSGERDPRFAPTPGGAGLRSPASNPSGPQPSVDPSQPNDDRAVAHGALSQRLRWALENMPAAHRSAAAFATLVMGHDGRGLPPRHRDQLLAAAPSVAALRDEVVDALAELSPHAPTAWATRVASQLVGQMGDGLFADRAVRPVEAALKNAVDVADRRLAALGSAPHEIESWLGRLIDGDPTAAQVAQRLQEGGVGGPDLAGRLLDADASERTQVILAHCQQQRARLAALRRRVPHRRMRMFDLSPEVTRRSLRVGDLGWRASDYPFASHKPQNAAQQLMLRSFARWRNDQDKVLTTALAVTVSVLLAPVAVGLGAGLLAGLGTGLPGFLVDFDGATMLGAAEAADLVPAGSEKQAKRLAWAGLGANAVTSALVAASPVGKAVAGRVGGGMSGGASSGVGSIAGELAQTVAW